MKAFIKIALFLLPVISAAQSVEENWQSLANEYVGYANEMRLIKAAGVADKMWELKAHFSACDQRILDTYSCYANTRFALGEADKGVKLYDDLLALEIKCQGEASPDLGRLYNNYSVILIRSHQYREAIVAAEKGLRVIGSADTLLLETWAALELNLALSYKALGRINEYFEHIDESILFTKVSGSSRNEALIAGYNKFQTLIDCGFWEAAIYYKIPILDDLESDVDASDLSTWIQIRSIKSRFQSEILGMYNKAEEQLNLLNKEFAEITDSKKAVSNVEVRERIRLYTKMKDYKKAGEWFDRLENYTDTEAGINNPENLAVYLRYLRMITKESGRVKNKSMRSGYAHLLSGYFIEKFEHYVPYLGFEEQVYYMFDHQPELEEFYDYIVDAYGDMAAAKSTITEQYFKVRIAQKQNLLRNTSGQLKKAIEKSGDEASRDKLAEYLKLKNELSQGLSLVNTGTQLSDSVFSALTTRIKSLEYELSTSLTINTNPRLNADDIRSQLGLNEAYIDINRLSYEGRMPFYLVGIMRWDSEKDILISIGEPDRLEGDLFNRYMNAIKFKIQDVSSYGYYWSKIDPFLEGIEKVYLNPEGAYSMVNVNTLFDTEMEEYVFEKYDIQYLLSPNTQSDTSTIIQSIEIFGNPVFGDGPPDENRGSLTFAPLPGAENEANTITDLAQKHGITHAIHTGPEATENEVKDLSGPDALHIATHGYFSISEDTIVTNNATLGILNSGLLFSGSQDFINEEKLLDGENGFLSAYEIFDVDLIGTDLVVLSACETGRGSVYQGQSVFGLRSALRGAGAANLMLSYWKVDDTATKEFMELFYGYLFESQNLDSAFRQARLDVYEKYKSPYYWGAFELYR